jgi:uncharacterized protein (DUF58 family)
MELGFRELNARIEELDKRLKRRADAISYPPWLMMPTNEGARFLLATFLLGLASLNTGNNLIYLIFGLMLSIVILSYVMVTINLSGLRLKVRVPGPVYASEESEIIIRIRNTKGLASYSLRIKLPDELQSTGYVPYIPGGGSSAIRVRIRPPGRGVFGYGNFIVESSYPFIFFRRRFSVHVDGSLTVYPALMDIDMDILHGRRGQGDDALRPGEGDELLSLREFREGDSRKLVHWKASAKAGGLLVKEYSANLPRMATIVLDGSGPPEPPSFEKAVSYAASAALRLVDLGYYVGLKGPGVDLPYGSGRAHVYRLLESLALVKEDDSTDAIIEGELRGAVMVVRKSSAHGDMHISTDPDFIIDAADI